MFRLRDVSLRTKLNALLIGYTVTVAAVMGLAGYLLAKYRVGGPVYADLAEHGHLTNELRPPPLLIGRPYLMLQELETATDPAEVRRLTGQYRQFEAEYHKRREFWLTRDIDPAVRQALESTGHQAAVEVFRLANEEYLPNLKGDAAAKAKAVAVLRDQIGPHYREQSKTIQEAAKAVDAATALAAS